MLRRLREQSDKEISFWLHAKNRANTRRLAYVMRLPRPSQKVHSQTRGLERPYARKACAQTRVTRPCTSDRRLVNFDLSFFRAVPSNRTKTVLCVSNLFRRKQSL